jgi:hypothetical protein
MIVYLILSTIALHSFGQGNYFIAGDTTDVIYYNYDPDIILEIPGEETFNMDIDLNGTDDFAIETHYSEGISHLIYYIRVLSYGANRVGCDTVGAGTMAIGLSGGESIDSTILFCSGNASLIEHWEGLGPNWYASWTPGDYIPVCLLNENGSTCIYGWIEVKNVSGDGITIEAHAVNIPTITSISSRMHSNVRVHPNPTDKGSVTFTLDNPNNLHLTCFNTFGQQVHQQEVTGTETAVNVSNWPPGIYLAVVYEDGKLVRRSKFVVR